MTVGLIVDGTDHFSKPIEAELRHRHHVECFSPRFIRMPLIGKRVNDYLLKVQLQHFMQSHDVVFFEWASDLLIKASHLDKPGNIVVRMHSADIVKSASQVDWSNVRAAIVVSHAMKHQFLEIVGETQCPIYVVYNGVDLERFRPIVRQYQHRIGMVCNINPIKRVYEAIIAISHLHNVGVPATLRVIGSIESAQEPRYSFAVRHLIPKLGLNEYVTLEGYVDDPANAYHEIDIFLSNSYWEGQQVALLEALASGCYCLSHCWDGVEEILPQEQIFTTESDLQDKMLAYVALPETAKASEQARMRAIAEDRFGEERMVDNIMHVIDDVLSSQYSPA